MLIRAAIFLTCSVALSFAAEANEVTLRHHGLTLNANFELAPGKQPADGVILITHGGLTHRDVESFLYLRRLLNQKGYSTLAINLSLGLDNRHDVYDCQITHRHRNADAADEIGAWLGWLKTQGVKRMVLLGHSRGGAQTALYAAEHDDALVKAVVLMAPAIRENTDAAAYQQRYQKSLAPLLEKAQKNVDNGDGDTVIEHIGLLNCPETSATASSFVSYYRPDAPVDTPALLPKIKYPTLVLIAGSDETVVGLDKIIAPLAGSTHLQMKVIDGADHTFRDLYADDAVDAITGFLKGVHYN